MFLSFLVGLGFVINDREPLWWLTKDGDLACLELYRRHYSSREYNDGRKRVLFCGPGQKIVSRGLVAGVIPTSMAKKSDQLILDFVLLPQDGRDYQSERKGD